MAEEAIAFERGGNVFRDPGVPNPELEQLRATLAICIVDVLDATGMSVRKAQAVTGTAAADFSRLRRANLGRFTVDRLMGILNRLDQEVTVSVEVHPRCAMPHAGSDS